MAGSGYWSNYEEEQSAIREADRRRQRFDSTAQSLTEEDGQRALEMLKRNPNLSAILLQALVQEGVTDEQADMVAQHDDGGLLGPVGRVAGDVIETATDAAATAWETAYEQAIKPAIRGVTLASETAAQELAQRPGTASHGTQLSSIGGILEMGASSVATGSIEPVRRNLRSFRENYNEYGDSPGLNILQGDLNAQEEAEQGTLGEGFFPAGAAVAESDRERRLKIRGQRADIGQAVANSLVGQFSAPGEAAYDVAAGIAGFAADVGGDPLAWGVGGVSRVAKGLRALSKTDAIKALDEVGLVAGEARNTLLVDKARNFFGSEKLLDRLADADAYTIMQSWSNSMANRIDLDTIRRLGDATDQHEVAEALFEAVARGDVTRKGFYSGMGNFVKRNLVQSQGRLLGPLRYFTPEGKLAGLAAKGQVSADDLGAAAGKVDSLLRQSNVERGARADIFNRIANIEEGSHDELLQVMGDAMDEVAKKVSSDVDTSLTPLVRAYGDELNELRQYGNSSWGDAVNVPYAKRKLVENFDGETRELLVPTPQITAELNSLALHLPDATEIRRAATDNALLRTVYTSRAWKGGADAAKSFTRKVFKPLAILRPAYIVRIGAEEQARLTAAGFDSIFNHPFRFIQANIRKREELTDLLGGDLADYARAQDVITKDAHGVVQDIQGLKGRIFTLARRAEGEELSDEFVRGWRSELGQLHAAPEARKLTELRGNIDEFKAWAQEDGFEHIERLSKINDEAASLTDFGDDFDEWAAGLRERISAKTAGWDEDLTQRIVDGDIPLPGPEDASQTGKAAFANFLRGKARNGRAPAAVKVEVVDEGRKKMLDRATDYLFDHITGKPTSYLARFPAFRQSLVRRTGELMESLADDGLRADVLERADDAWKLTRKERNDLADAARSAKGVGGPIESVRDLDMVVKQKASQDVKDLLFDVTERSAAQDALEAVVPFLDAWKEVTTNWMRLVKENPAFFIRAQAGYRNLQDQGHFYANEFGDEVFSYPGGGFFGHFVDRMSRSGGELGDAPGAALGAAADFFTGREQRGAGTKFEGRVQGLNLVAQGTGPGFGPLVQWGAGLFGDSPKLDDFKDFIAPFGSDVEQPEDILEIPKHVLPSWARKIANGLSGGGISKKQWNSTVGDSMKALAASGDYSPDEQDRLLEDAKRLGRWTLLARGVGQAVLPTGPQDVQQVDAKPNPEHEDWNPEIDPDGRMFSTGVLASDYHRLAKTYGYEQANQKFYELYGVEPFFIKQAKTKSVRELPVTAEGDRWMREHQDFVKDYPVVAGFFAPADEDAELDYTVYANQIESGERQSLTPKQQLEEANKVRARAMLGAVKERVKGLPSKARNRVLSITRGKLEELYPGWDSPTVGLAESLRTHQKIEQLERAVSDPRLEDNPLVEPLKTYLRIRHFAHEKAAERGLKTLASDRVSDLRSKLEEVGTVLQHRYPDSFAGVWVGLLEHEVRD